MRFRITMANRNVFYTDVNLDGLTPEQGVEAFTNQIHGTRSLYFDEFKYSGPNEFHETVWEATGKWFILGTGQITSIEMLDEVK